MKLNVDFSTSIGPIKAMHGVGQPPLLGLNTDKFCYLSEAGIPYSRLHDVAGWFGGNMFVDIPNIFRDFDADETNPASYDFTFTDILITGLVEHNCKPVYRLGVTIENFHNIKAYRVYPPKDFAKWARICEHIIRHYNEGWADGFHYDIKYWEIWNEPDSSVIIADNPMWKGTPEQFFDLYKITALHLRKCFGNTIKIGGYGASGFYAVFNAGANGAAAEGKQNIPDAEMQALINRRKGYVKFFDRFIRFVKEENLPFDFFSYHSYANAEDTLKMQQYVEQNLREQGLEDTEIHLNEWNPSPNPLTRGTALAASNTAAMMCAMQNTRMDMMCYYDARIGTSVYGGLFNPLTYKPFCTYYALKAFGELYKLGTQAQCDWEADGIYAVAATGESGKGILLTNTTESAVFVECPQAAGMSVQLIDDSHNLEPVKWNPVGFPLGAYQTVLLCDPS